MGHLRVWWSEVDKVLLGLIFLLMSIGAAAVAAASPASANRLSTSAVRLDELHFFWLHLQFMALGVATMLGISFAPKDWARRGGILLAVVMIGALMLVPLIGYEVNGAKRWLRFGIGLQPSEFLKPGFAILMAWIISWRIREPDMPVIPISAGILGLICLLLMLQPNLGGTILFVGVWFALVMLAGLPLQRIGMLVGGGGVALVMAYLFYDNARHRIDAFFGGGTAFDQVDLAARTLQAGGWTGTGFMLGTRKMSLPEAHTDYIFSVIGEEFGLLICAVVAMLYLAIVLRVLSRMMEEEDLFTILAASGLATLVGGQAFINIMVNLQLFPSKGMTLPLVSYGGSSTLALGITVGLLLAITRRNPYLSRDRFDWRNALAKGGEA
jgi:cell division protein FtsW